MKPHEQERDPTHGTDARPEDPAPQENSGRPEQDTDTLQQPTKPRTLQEQSMPDVDVNNSVSSEHPDDQ